MQTPPREEEQRGGAGGAEGEVGTGEEVRDGAASQEPALHVWVALHVSPFSGKTLDFLGVAGTASGARSFVEDHWDERARRVGRIDYGGRLLWLEGRAYYTLSGRRFEAPYIIRQMPVR